MKNHDDNKLSSLLKQHGPKLFINIVIVVAILAAIDYFKEDIVMVIIDFDIPLLTEPELLLTIVSIILIIYPIVSLLGRIEKVVTSVSDAISTKLIPGKTIDEIENKPMHRLVRNIFFVAALLIMVAIIQPYITEIAEIELLSIVISAVGLGLAIILIADTVFVFNKISHSHIMDSLLKEDEKMGDPEGSHTK